MAAQKGSASFTFAVHDAVRPARVALARSNADMCFKPFCDDPKKPLELLTVAKEQDHLVCDAVKTGLQKKSMTNGLAAACICAWNNHYSLVLSPDAIWIAVAQGLSAHVSANSETLRSAFVDHQGKETITLRAGDYEGQLFDKSNPFDWKAAIGDFSTELGKRVRGNVRELVECNFSCTGPVELTASQVALMDAMSPYFHYEMMCICGIPEVTLTGTVDDWKKIRAKAEALAPYGLDWWLEELLPVLDHFVRAREGNPDVKFWQRICRQDGGTIHGNAYNRVPEFVSGWLSVFFPYGNSGEKRTLRWAVPKPDVLPWHKDPSEPADPSELKDQSAEYGLRIYNTDFPSGMSSAQVDIVMPGPGEKIKLAEMRVLAGLVGVEQDPESLALKPAVSWAVCRVMENRPREGGTRKTKKQRKAK